MGTDPSLQDAILHLISFNTLTSAFYFTIKRTSLYPIKAMTLPLRMKNSCIKFYVESNLACWCDKMELKGLRPGLTIWGEMGSLLEQGADDTMKTSSAPRSSSVNPLQERSTSAFSELSVVAVETQKKQTKNHNKIYWKQWCRAVEPGFSFYKNQLNCNYTQKSNNSLKQDSS